MWRCTIIFQLSTESIAYSAVLLSLDKLVILHQRVKMSSKRSSKKFQLDEHCGTQAKDHTNERVFQNHYKNHSDNIFECEVCHIKVNTRKKLSSHNFEYHSSNFRSLSVFQQVFCGTTFHSSDVRLEALNDFRNTWESIHKEFGTTYTLKIHIMLEHVKNSRWIEQKGQ